MAVRLSRVGLGALLEVTDAGQGMDDEAAARAFDRFYRGGHNGNDGHGSGLGLSIVQAIAAAHGGHAMLKSARGAGTSVQVWIPFQPPAQHDARADAASGRELQLTVTVICRTPPSPVFEQIRPYADDSTTVWSWTTAKLSRQSWRATWPALADAYDRYAESVYGYCHWMLNETADAADAVQDTFVIAAGKLGGLRDPRKLRPWLYAVARNECHRRLRPTEVGLDEAADVADLDRRVGDESDRAELRSWVRSALSGLAPGEREILELDLRHDLHGADLAAVLGVSRNQAHALGARARGQLEKALGALLLARTGRRSLPGPR